MIQGEHSIGYGGHNRNPFFFIGWLFLTRSLPLLTFADLSQPADGNCSAAGELKNDEFDPLFSWQGGDGCPEGLQDFRPRNLPAARNYFPWSEPADACRGIRFVFCGYGGVNAGKDDMK